MFNGSSQAPTPNIRSRAPLNFGDEVRATQCSCLSHPEGTTSNTRRIEPFGQVAVWARSTWRVDGPSHHDSEALRSTPTFCQSFRQLLPQHAVESHDSVAPEGFSNVIHVYSIGWDASVCRLFAPASSTEYFRWDLGDNLAHETRSSD